MDSIRKQSEDLKTGSNEQTAKAKTNHSHKTLAERVRESGQDLTGIGELDWGEPRGGEIWQ